jgi:hypothetical protein
MRIIFVLFFAFIFLLKTASAQYLGGQTVFQFLGNTNTAQYNAMGQKNVSFNAKNNTAFLQNPAIWQANKANHLSVDFKTIYGTTLSLASYNLKSNESKHTSFAVAYNNYGSLTRTDAAGNTTGKFNAFDYALMYSIGRNKEKLFTYGATIKLAGSQIDISNGLALATDLGLHYSHPTNGFSAGFAIKNFGINLKKIGSISDALPFDMQIGFTKRIQKAPFAFSFTIHQLNQFNTFYNDTIFTNAILGTVKKVNFFNKLANHFVVGFHIIPSEHLSFDVGYQVKMRRELLFPGLNNGLTSLSAGLNISKKDFVLSYATQFLLVGKPTHQINIALPLSKKIF